MGMLKMRSIFHCAILLPSRCKQWQAWFSYVEQAVHRFPIKFSQRRVMHWLRHQYIGNSREGTCLLPNCQASTTILTNLTRQTLSQGWATLPCLNSRETRAFLFLGGQILFDQSKLASFGYFNFYSFLYWDDIQKECPFYIIHWFLYLMRVSWTTLLSLLSRPRVTMHRRTD